MKQKKKLRDIFKKYKAFQNYYVDEIGHAIPKSAVHFKHVAPKKPLDNKSSVKEDVEPEHPHIRNWFGQFDNDHLMKHKTDDSRTHALGVSLHLEQHHQKPMSDTEMNHVYDYTSDSHDINHNLINNHIKNEEIKPEHKEMLKSLDSVANNKLKDHLHLYSGVSFHPGEMAAKSKDHIIHLPAYTSTTHDKGTAARFYNPMSKDRHILHIHAKPGDKIGHISHVSRWNEEHESILPRNTQLKIHPKPDSYTNDQGITTHIWHADVHHQD